MNSAILSFPEPERTRITYREVDVTPDLAQRWLGLNTSNRKLRARLVSAYAADMAAGRWELNGEFIKFAGPEYAPTKLLDGQNRLHAVLKSGVTVRLSIAFNVPVPAQKSMDSGSKRTVADNLTINGAQNTTEQAAAARIAMMVEDGTLSAGRNASYTNVAVEAFIADRPSLANSAAIAARYAKRSDVSKAIVTYTHWVMAQLDLDAATTFWRDAAEKVGLPAGDPVIAMTNWFANARRDHVQVSLPIALSVVFRAWNYRRANKSWSFVRINSVKGGVIDIPQPR